MNIDVQRLAAIVAETSFSYAVYSILQKTDDPAPPWLVGIEITSLETEFHSTGYEPLFLMRNLKEMVKPSFFLSGTTPIQQVFFDCGGAHQLERMCTQTGVLSDQISATIIIRQMDDTEASIPIEGFGFCELSLVA